MGSISEALTWATESEVRGEFCLIIEGATTVEQSQKKYGGVHSILLDMLITIWKQNQLNSKEAIKLVAKDRGMQKRDVYQAYHIEKNKDDLIQR